MLSRTSLSDAVWDSHRVFSVFGVDSLSLVPLHRIHLFSDPALPFVFSRFIVSSKPRIATNDRLYSMYSNGSRYTMPLQKIIHDATLRGGRVFR